MKSSSISIPLLLTTLPTASSFTATSLSISRTPPTHLASTITNPPEWDTKQHLYGLDLVDSTTTSITLNADGDEIDKPLPLPETYVTCGKCKCLFAIAESDLGTMGKGW
jgi:hypothetical protein